MLVSVVRDEAGTGEGGYNGDGVLATRAQLNMPTDLALDPQGNLLIADSWNHRIRKLTRDGRISTVAGAGLGGMVGDGGPAVSAYLHEPSGIATDAKGNLFIADKNNHRIRKVDSAGIISTVAGTGKRDYVGDGGPAGQAGLKNPRGLSVDTAGNLIIADTFHSVVRTVLVPTVLP